MISAIALVACAKETFPEVDSSPVPTGYSSEISPVAYVDPATLPPGATKALIDVNTVVSMEANALRIDEKKNDDEGTYQYDGWDQAYLTEANVASSPSATGLRSMFLNPVQTYDYKVLSQEDTIFYHTRMISWYPRTCNLHKNEQGKATVMKFYDFNQLRNGEAFDMQDGNVVLKFKNLDGSKDVMVSNIAEGQHWHGNRGGDGHDMHGSTDTYTYPFGHSNAHPIYSNSMTYKHYLSAVKVYAYAEESYQDVAMWGALRKVYVKNQPSGVSVQLPSPAEMEDAVISGNEQSNAPSYGEATFTGKTDFPLLKTPMFGSDVNDPANQEVADEAPHLVQGQRIYLGYALIKPNVDDNQKLELDVHTDAGVLSVAVPMTQVVDDVTTDYFKAGYIYHVDIKFNTEGTIAGIIMQSGDEHYFDLSSGSEFEGGVHDYKFANCYIVHPGIKRSNGDYYDGYAFSATTVGNGESGLYPEFSSDRTSVEIDPVRAGLLWESSPGLITQVELLYGYVRFKVQPPDSESYKEGNAVIAVYDSRRMVLWSWHIWVTDKPEDVSYTVGSKTIKLMDRNIGATSDQIGTGDLLQTYGLYYQWGRKDPSMGPPESHYLPQSTATMDYYDYYGYLWNYAGVVTMAQPTIRDGVENPMYLLLPTDFSMTTYQYDWLYTDIDNLWGDYSHDSAGSTSKRLKTIYDPCPFGYMVPQDEIVTLFTGSSTSVTDGTGRTISGTRNGSPYESFFPYAGFKGVDKGVSSLTGAWKYVGAKGDYMSSKIDPNGHRTRTYISESNYWVEYGADADNDGDGDASRTYSSNVFADDVANRRTAASVRCVRRDAALNAALAASFTGDRLYAFVGDGQITFTYDVQALMSEGFVKSAYMDLNGTKLTVDAVGNDITNLSDLTKHISGEKTFVLPNLYGVHRYRLISESSNGAVSRIGYVLRMFDIPDLKVKASGADAYVDYNADGYKYDHGKKYSVKFTLKGTVSDYTVLVNGVQAERGTITDEGNEKASIAYTIEIGQNGNDGINVPGHLHIQIQNAEGQLACEKSYTVDMEEVTSYTVQVGNPVRTADDLKAGGMYVISPYPYTVNSKHYCLAYDSSAPSQFIMKEYNIATNPTVTADMVFLFHRDDTKAGGVSGYQNVCAGAWVSASDGKFLQEDFTFGSEQSAVYMTIACRNNQRWYFFLRDTGQYFYYNNSVPMWGPYGFAYTSQWNIYPVTPN